MPPPIQATPLVSGSPLATVLQPMNVAIAQIAASVQKLVAANTAQTASTQSLTAASFNASAVFGNMTGSIGQLRNITGLALNSIGQLTGAISANVASFVKMYSPVEVVRFQLALNDLHASIGRALLPILERFLLVTRGIGDTIASLSPTARSMIAALVAAGVGMVALTVVTEAFAAAAASATGGLSLILGALAGGLASIAFVSKDLGAVGRAVEKLSIVGRQVFEIFGDAFGRIVAAAQPVIDRLGALASGLVGPLTAFLETITGNVAGLIEQLGPVLESLAPAVTQAVTAVLQLVAGLHSLDFNLFLGPIVQLIGALAPAVVLLGTPVRLVVSLLGTLAQVVGQVFGAALNLAFVPLKVFGQVIGAVADAVGAAVGELQEAFSEIGSLAREIGGIINELAAELLKELKPLIDVMKDAAIGAVRDLVSGLRLTVQAIKEVVAAVRSFLGIEPSVRANPAGAGVGLAVRNVQHSSLDDAIRRAQAASFAAGRPPEESPIKKAAGHLETIDRNIANLPKNLADALKGLLVGGPNNVASAPAANNDVMERRAAARQITG